jgi:hypothetical protein
MDGMPRQGQVASGEVCMEVVVKSLEQCSDHIRARPALMQTLCSTQAIRVFWLVWLVRPQRLSFSIAWQANHADLVRGALPSRKLSALLSISLELPLHLEGPLPV